MPKFTEEFIEDQINSWVEETEDNSSVEVLKCSDEEVDWKAMAIECRDALRLMHRHYFDDLAKSNPGFMGNLVLQDYALWNDAMIAERKALDKYGY